MRRFTLGELCELVRGVSPTLKTEPGPFPLVVTAGYRRSSAEWQIEGPAVCIPLISSTGHGDAAIHRVHYQEGRFALANLMVALLPRSPDDCDAKYLYFQLSAKKDQLLVPLMLGTANVSLKERDIAGVEVSLPPVPEQRRVVAQIEEVAGLVEEARVLQREVAQELLNTARALVLNDAEKALVPLSELVQLRPPDVTVQPSEHYEFAGVRSFGRGVFRGQRKSGMEFSYPRLTRLRAGDFVYPKLMAWEGAFGVVPSSCAGCVVSTEFPVFEILAERVLPEVLDVYFRDPAVWPAISGSSIGTNVRRRRLNPQDFLRWKLPVPSRRTQQCLRELVISADAVGKLQSESSASLEALLPAVLDSAFRGEL